MDPVKRKFLAARDAEERPSHGIRCRNCTLLLEQCQCSAKFPHLRSRTTYQVLAPRAPTKPFSFFFDDVSASLHRQHPSASPSEIGLLLRQQWTQLDAAAKAKYHTLAEADEERFQREKAHAIQNAKHIQQHEEEVSLPSGKLVKILRGSADRRPSSADARTDDSNAFTTARSLEHRHQRLETILLSGENGPARSRDPAPAFVDNDSRSSFRKPSPRLKLPSMRPRGASSNNEQGDTSQGHSSGRTRGGIGSGLLQRHSIPAIDAHTVLETIERQSDAGTFRESQRRARVSSKQKVTLPRLAVELVTKPAHFLNAEGRLEEGVEERPVLVEVAAPRVDPLDLNIFKSCHKDDDRPLMPSMRAKYGGARYVEPLAPRTELSYLEVRFRENKLERERAEREKAKRKAAAKPRSTRDDQRIFVNGVPTRKVKVGRFGWRMAGELLIFSIYQVGMDGRVFVSRAISSDGGSEESDKPSEIHEASRYFELNAYNPSTSIIYRLDVHVDEIIEKFGYDALELLRPGHKSEIIRRILGNLYFADANIPSRKSLALAAVNQVIEQKARPPSPNLLSPRSVRRQQLLERRNSAKRNRDKLAMVARLINSHVFQVSVAVRSAYGACFYVECYLPSTCAQYVLPVPFSEVRGLLPDFELAKKAPAEWDEARRAMLARELARRVSIRRVETKFDGVQCCATLGPGGCRRGVLGPELPAAKLFRDTAPNQQVQKFSKFLPMQRRALRDILQLKCMHGPSNKVAGGVARFGTTRRMCQFVVYKEREDYMSMKARSFGMRLVLYFPDSSAQYNVSFSLCDAATLFMDKYDFHTIASIEEPLRIQPDVQQSVCDQPKMRVQLPPTTNVDAELHSNPTAGANLVAEPISSDRANSQPDVHFPGSRNPATSVCSDSLRSQPTSSVSSVPYESSIGLKRRLRGTPTVQGTRVYTEYAKAIIRHKLFFREERAAGDPTRKRSQSAIEKLVFNRIVLVRPCFLEERVENSTAADDGVVVSIFGNSDSDDDDDDNLSEDSLEAAQNEDGAQRTTAHGATQEDSDSEVLASDAEDSDDDSEEAEAKRVRREAKAEAKREKELASQPTIAAELAKFTCAKSEKKRRFMLVKVSQNGPTFTFTASDLSPGRRTPALSCVWHDEMSAMLASDLMAAPPEKRTTLLEINVDSLGLVSTGTASNRRWELRFYGGMQ